MTKQDQLAVLNLEANTAVKAIEALNDTLLNLQVFGGDVDALEAALEVLSRKYAETIDKKLDLRFS